jgi:hypothetical protein
VSNSILEFIQNHWKHSPRELLELAVKTLHLPWRPPCVGGQAFYEWMESSSQVSDSPEGHFAYEVDSVVRLFGVDGPLYVALVESLSSKTVEKEAMKEFLTSTCTLPRSPEQS